MDVPDEAEGPFALEFFDEVRIVEAADPQLVGRLGAVLGRSRATETGAESYAVAIDGESRTWMLPLHHLTRTGQQRSREDFYPS